MSNIKELIRQMEARYAAMPLVRVVARIPISATHTRHVFSDGVVVDIRTA